jgi:DNA-binding HxlR family transcriptional regulator
MKCTTHSKGIFTSMQGISSRVLTARLRVLEEKRFVFRDHEPTIPPSVTYGITKRMKDISKAMGALDELARKWQQRGRPRPYEAGEW